MTGSAGRFRLRFSVLGATGSFRAFVSASIRDKAWSLQLCIERLNVVQTVHPVFQAAVPGAFLSCHQITPSDVNQVMVR
ncbi:MAG: hypothetical protein CMJ42_22715 [Phyllobacteriaceae bacterium]|nr:hypothetical protein [Phyllobacteriaceae bacterium]